MIKKILYYILTIIHLLFAIIPLYVIFFSKNILYNLITYYFLYILSILWLLSNICILTPLENYLNENKEKNSFIAIIISKKFNVSIYDSGIYLIYFNYILFLILSIKLYFLNKNNKKIK